MEVPKKNVCFALLMTVLLLVVFVTLLSSSNPRTNEMKELMKTYNDSSMAARVKQSEILNEKAVQDPEEVVAMVEM
ncbi:hypothetical protein Tco_1352425 [Tanacetum coccineum]